MSSVCKFSVKLIWHIITSFFIVEMIPRLFLMYVCVYMCVYMFVCVCMYVCIYLFYYIILVGAGVGGGGEGDAVDI